MNHLADADTFSLVLINVVLGIGCLAIVIVVGVAATLDLRERWRIRASIPKGWPPDEPPARVLPLPRPSRRREGSHTR